MNRVGSSLVFETKDSIKLRNCVIPGVNQWILSHPG